MIHHDSTNYTALQGLWQGDAGIFSLTKEEKAGIDKINRQYSAVMKRISKIKGKN